MFFMPIKSGITRWGIWSQGGVGHRRGLIQRHVSGE